MWINTVLCLLCLHRYHVGIVLKFTVVNKHGLFRQHRFIATYTMVGRKPVFHVDPLWQ